MSEVIFGVSSTGELTELAPSSPPTEDALQQLIARHPKIISDEDGELLLVRREQPIGDSEHFAPRWSIDHLFVTHNAIPVLVEVKRATDTRIRREVVGQMLDYAANSVAYWPAGQVQEAFARTALEQSLDPDEVIREFVGGKETVASFWAQVDANFHAGRIKMVFVADRIPAELARIIEFLNDQMAADVRGVELNYFASSDGSRVLAPRVIGQTQQAKARKSNSSSMIKMTVEDWLRKYVEPLETNVAEGVAAVLQLMESLADEVGVTVTGGSIFASVSGHKSGMVTYPFSIENSGRGFLGMRWVARYVPEEVRQQYLEQFEKDVSPLSTANTQGYPAFELTQFCKAENAEKLKIFLQDWFGTVRRHLDKDAD